MSTATEISNTLLIHLEQLAEGLGYFRNNGELGCPFGDSTGKHDFFEKVAVLSLACGGLASSTDSFADDRQARSRLTDLLSQLGRVMREDSFPGDLPDSFRRALIDESERVRLMVAFLSVL